MGQFHQQSTSSFYASRSRKRKKDSQGVNLLCAFGICARKSCSQNVDEIDTMSLYVQLAHDVSFHYNNEKTIQLTKYYFLTHFLYFESHKLINLFAFLYNFSDQISPVLFTRTVCLKQRFMLCVCVLSVKLIYVCRGPMIACTTHSDHIMMCGKVTLCEFVIVKAQ